MKDIQVFNFEEKNVRTVEKGGEAWFVLKDVCDVLELTNVTETLKRIDEADFSETEDRSTGQLRKIKIINESGLYAVIFQSTKPNAKEFKRWVTSEVLPSIRKTGGYMATDNREFIDIMYKYIALTEEHTALIHETYQLKNAPKFIKVTHAERESIQNAYLNDVPIDEIAKRFKRHKDTIKRQLLKK